MKCLGGHTECLSGTRLQSFFTLFTRATPGTPASYHIKSYHYEIYNVVTVLPIREVFLYLKYAALTLRSRLVFNWPIKRISTHSTFTTL